MKIRKYAVMAVMLVMFMLTTAHAANEKVANYLVEGTYHPETKTYTAEVWLDTTEYLANGSFGMAYDPDLNLRFILDSQFVETGYLNDFNLSDETYVVKQWRLRDVSPLTGKLHFASIIVTNVEDDNGRPKNWHMRTLRQLNWNDTPMAATDRFQAIDDDISLNREIWRDMTAEEAEEYKAAAIAEGEDEDDIVIPDGYYQGYAINKDVENYYDKWIDIGFIFTSEPELTERDGITLSGSVQAFNPSSSKPVTITVTEKETGDVVDTVTMTEYKTEYINGMVIGTYEITLDKIGDYTIKFEKDVHLTYETEINVPEGRTEITVSQAVLYCGDIMRDEKIKLEDRYLLMVHMEKQMLQEYAEDEAFKKLADRCDLNGDGKINLRDLNIIKMYYNKSYDDKGGV